MESRVTNAEQATPSILRTGGAQEKVAILAGQAASLQASYEERLATEEQEKELWKARVRELEAATRGM